MDAQRTISRIARETGVSARTIRFYEAAGALPAPARTASGYRIYGESDVRRLRLLRNARLLGLSLSEAAELAGQALDSDCRAFAPELARRIATKREDVQRRIAALRELHEELVALEQQVRQAECVVTKASRVSECDYSPGWTKRGD